MTRARLPGSPGRGLRPGEGGPYLAALARAVRLLRERAAEHRQAFNLTTAQVDEEDAAVLDALRVALDDRAAGSSTVK